MTKYEVRALFIRYGFKPETLRNVGKFDALVAELVEKTGAPLKKPLSTVLMDGPSSGAKPSDYPRPVHLARLIDFTLAEAKDKTEAARMVLRRIDPSLPQKLPEAVEKLAKAAASAYGDEQRNKRRGTVLRD